MKTEAKLSFTKIKSRPNNVNLAQINALRKFFTVKFTQIIDNQTLILNIDESSINRSTKSHYSLSFKGFPAEIKNAPFVGSASIILGICSNGPWLALITNKTMNSQNFTQCLSSHNCWLKRNSNFGYSKVLIMLDNCSVHKSKTTKQALNSLNAGVLYIPPYSPDFAPSKWGSACSRKVC